MDLLNRIFPQKKRTIEDFVASIEENARVDVLVIKKRLPVPCYALMEFSYHALFRSKKQDGKYIAFEHDCGKVQVGIRTRMIDFIPGLHPEQIAEYLCGAVNFVAEKKPEVKINIHYKGELVAYAENKAA